MSATNIANLKLARERLITKIAALEADPQPDVSIDGQSIAYDTQLNSMYARLEKIDKLIQQAEGPILVSSYGRAV